MLKFIIVFFLMLTAAWVNAQNIYTALHLNKEREYKTVRPKKIVETNIFYNSNGEQADRNVKLLDGAGMLLTEERFDESGKLKARLVYNNDTLNRLILSDTFERWSQFGQFKEITFFTYDANHFLTKVSTQDQNGVIIRLAEIINDEKGNPVELSLSDGNGNSFGKEKAEYLYEKNQLVTAVISAEGKILSTDTSKISYKNASRFPGNEEAFNDKGDLVYWTGRSISGKEIIYEEEYIYDHFGNCTEDKMYKVTVLPNGKREKEIDRIFQKEYTY